MDARIDPALDPRLESLLEHAEWARGLAGRLVADAARADDVVQRALASAVKSPPRDATNLRGWLGEVVRNAARGIGREEGRRASREHAAAKSESLESTVDLVARAEMSRDLAQHVLALEPIYRDVVLLRWYEGLTPRSIAKRLGVPVATVNTRLARAHGELRTRLDRTCGDRANWCVAFAPFALMPKTAVPAGAVAVAGFVLLVAGGIGVATWRASRDVSSVALTSEGTFVALEAEAVALPGEAATESSDSRSSPAETAGRKAISTASEASTPTPTKPTPRTELRGRVLDMTGQGVPGLHITALDRSLPTWIGDSFDLPSGHHSVDPELRRDLRDDVGLRESLLSQLEHPPGLRELLQGMDPVAHTTTLADGSFVLDALGAAPVAEFAEEGWAIVKRGRIPDEDVSVWLVARTVRVAGTVVDRGGVPIDGARLLTVGEGAAVTRLPFEFETSMWGEFEEETTDSLGRFDLGSVPTFPEAGIQVVIGTLPILRVAVPHADATDLVFVVERPAKTSKPRVSGIVLDLQGVPIAKAEVRLEGNRASTGVDGRFEFEAENFGPEADLVATQRGLSPGWIAGFGRELIARRVIEGVEIRIAGPARSITGHAADAQGGPLVGWYVSLEGAIPYPQVGIPIEFVANGQIGDAQRPKTDERGRFELGGLAPQPYRVRLVDPATGLVQVSAPIQAGSQGVELVVLHDAWLERVFGRVLSTRGLPLADIEVGVTYPWSEGHSFSSSRFAQKSVTDSSGAFEFQRVPRNSPRFSVHGQDIEGAGFVLEPGFDPSNIVLKVGVNHRFRVEVDADPSVDGFEVRDGSDQVLDVDEITDGSSQVSRARRGREGFSICSVSEKGVMIVLYRGEVEVRRSPIVWSDERIQILRP